MCFATPRLEEGHSDFSSPTGPPISLCTGHDLVVGSPLLVVVVVQINIASFALGRVRTGGVAMSCLNLDTPCTEGMLEEIRKIPDIRNVVQVRCYTVKAKRTITVTLALIRLALFVSEAMLPQ